jgi:hypothetical protein
MKWSTLRRAAADSIALIVSISLVYPYPVFAAGEPAPNSKNIQHKLKIIQKPAIAFVPFEMKEPGTGKPIAADKILTLPDGKTIKAGEYFALLNQYEKEFNKAGYTLRSKAREKVMKTNVSPQRILEQRSIIQKSHLKTSAPVKALTKPLVSDAEIRKYAGKTQATGFSSSALVKGIGAKTPAKGTVANLGLSPQVIDNSTVRANLSKAVAAATLAKNCNAGTPAVGAAPSLQPGVVGAQTGFGSAATIGATKQPDTAAQTDTGGFGSARLGAQPAPVTQAPVQTTPVIKGQVQPLQDQPLQAQPLPGQPSQKQPLQAQPLPGQPLQKQPSQAQQLQAQQLQAQQLQAQQLQAQQLQAQQLQARMNPAVKQPFQTANIKGQGGQSTGNAQDLANAVRSTGCRFHNTDHFTGTLNNEGYERCMAAMVNVREDWNYPLGEADLLAAYVRGSIRLSSVGDDAQFDAVGRAGVALIGTDFHLVKLDATIKSRPNLNSINVRATLLTDDLVNINESANGPLIREKHENKSVEYKESFHFTIFVVPVYGEVGVRGSAGFDFIFKIENRSIYSQFHPYVKSKAWAWAEATVVVAGAGLSANMIILNDDLWVTGQIGLAEDVASGPKDENYGPYLYYWYNALNELVMFDGEMIGYVYFWVPCNWLELECVFHKVYKGWTLVDWAGIHKSGYIFRVDEHRYYFNTGNTESRLPVFNPGPFTVASLTQCGQAAPLPGKQPAQGFGSATPGQTTAPGTRPATRQK